jgi:archaellum component FlaG (FlaF/FlaG flagellin family)
MNTYTWITTKLYTIDVNTLTDYVVNAVYDVNGTDGTYSASLTNSCEFAVRQNDPNYIPYNQLTNTIVINWVKQTLGVDGVNSIQSSIDGIINSKANPPQTPQNTPLPF